MQLKMSSDTANQFVTSINYTNTVTASETISCIIIWGYDTRLSWSAILSHEVMILDYHYLLTVL